MANSGMAINLYSIDTQNDPNTSERSPGLISEDWDIFEDNPRKEDDDALNTELAHKFLKVIKVLSYFVSFIVVLGTAVVSKLSLLLMTSQADPMLKKTNLTSGEGNYRITHHVIQLTPEERMSWIWCLFFVLIVPELLAATKCFAWCAFKKYKKPKKETFILVVLIESLQAIGLSILVFCVLPNLTSVWGAMVTNGLCFIPCLLSWLSHGPNDKRMWMKLLLDSIALVCQTSVFLLWIFSPNEIVQKDARYLQWTVPLACALVSLNWWENYVNKHSLVRFVRFLSRTREDLDETRFFTYMWLSLWRIVVFFVSMVMIIYLLPCREDKSSDISCSEQNLKHLFKNFLSIFRNHKLDVYEIRADGKEYPLKETLITSSYWAPVCLFFIQALSSMICFGFSKFACKTCIQGIGFAFPISFTVPVSVSVLLPLCSFASPNVKLEEVKMNPEWPWYLFFKCDEGRFFQQFILYDHAWVWILWIISQLWITGHIWIPKFSRVGHRLFVQTFNRGILIDQSLVMNRWRDESEEDGYEQLKEDEAPRVLTVNARPEIEMNTYYDTEVAVSVSSRPSRTSGIKSMRSDVRKSDKIVRIYMCATMWHETGEEMIQFLKSVFRMDEDQCYRRMARAHFGSSINELYYYTLETHIFFDDAFTKKRLADDETVTVTNSFVKLLLNVIDKAASEIHKQNVIVSPPKRIPTPYGGKLVWTLPGKTKLIAHLKDKLKIRRKKRWSQVMYMYYLLGYRLMARPISTERKAVLASRTFLLALDGDVDFRPAAVQRLVELMVKHEDLGAACGRIHPVGTGLMVWFQKYEYAIGHWLQKATEHMIGCVLCSPGCFSLFRAESLMDDNVMKKYTSNAEEAIHYVQYDQGEDRWLCTLLLKQGYRIEYSAASDALTQCPEGFGEFYSQRRRWSPSTMANIMDLLMDYKHTVRMNNNINILFILYQFFLMIGSFLGPGTIFIMLVGSLSSAFAISTRTSFVLNIIPVIMFVIICFVTKNDTQVLFAQFLSALYALLMLAVTIGVAIELTETGPGAPSAIFLVIMVGSAVIAALLHPQEISNLLCGLVYFLCIPSMYLLLTIYSLINLNVVSWGTREVQPSPAEQEQQAVQQVAPSVVAASPGNRVLQWLGLAQSKKEEEGNISCGVASLFKIMFCTYPKPSEEKYMILALQEKLDSMQKQLSNMEKYFESGPSRPVSRSSSFNRRPSLRIMKGKVGFAGVKEEDIEEEPEDVAEDEEVSEKVEETETRIERDDLINPYWIEDLNQELAEKDALMKETQQEISQGLDDDDDDDDDDPRDIPDTQVQRQAENEFWKGLIKAYLFPKHEDNETKNRVSQELKDLRNRVVFALIMINAVFILVVFLLQSHKEIMHIKWPLEVKVNITFVPTSGEIHIEEKHMELDPIGLAFILSFTLILIVQFIAMLFHRFETFTTIMADISLPWCSGKTKDMKGDTFLKKNVVKLVREIKELEDEKERPDVTQESPIPSKDKLGRRGTVHNLAAKDRKKSIMKPLDEAITQNLMTLSNDARSEISQRSGASSRLLRKALQRRGTASLIYHRRDTLLSASPLSGRRDSIASNFTDRSNSIRSQIPNGMMQSASINEGYESDENRTNSGDQDQQVTSF